MIKSNKKPRNMFLCADLHFGHRKMVNTFRADGVTKQRPWDNVSDMDAVLVHRWNLAVGPKDLVFVAGDVAINRSAIGNLGSCNGEKILIKGNHDRFNLREYLPYFKDIVALHEIDGYIISHIPIHTRELDSGRWKGNLHGHLHEERVMRPTYNPQGGHLEGEEIDPRYYCVSLEHIDYAPIPLELAIERLEKQK